MLMIELTGRDRSFILPLMLIVCTATLVARTIETRSIYDARLTDEAGSGAAQRRAGRLPHAILILRGNWALSSRKVFLRFRPAASGCTTPLASVARDTSV